MSSDPSISDAVTKIESGIKSQEDNLENLKGELNSRREKLNYMALEAENENIRFLVKKLEQDLGLKTQSLNEANQETHRLGQQKQELQSEIETLSKNLQEYDGKLETLKDGYERKLKDKQEEIEKLLLDHSKKEEQFKTTENKLKSDIETLKGENEKISLNHEKLGAEKEDLLSVLDEELIKKKTLESTIRNLEVRIEDLSKSEADLLSQKGANEDSVAHVRTLESLVGSLKEELAGKDRELETFKLALESQEKNNQSLLKALEKTEKMCTDLQTSLESLRTRCSEFEVKVSEYSQSNEHLTKEVMEIRQELDDKLLEIERLKFCLLYTSDAADE